MSELKQSIRILFAVVTFCLSIPVKAETDDGSLSYALGYQFSTGLLYRPIDINMDALLSGISDAFGANSRLGEEEIRQALIGLEHKMAALKNSKENKAEQYRLKNEAYLIDNGKKDNVITTASGLQYEIIRNGDGRSPTHEDSVTVHYKGRLINDREFDSSYRCNQALSIKMSDVIDGWSEALLVMKAGAYWRLHIPPHLAYGGEVKAGSIPAHSALIFDVELLSVN